MLPREALLKFSVVSSERTTRVKKYDEQDSNKQNVPNIVW